jgi:hypothetical protein
MAAARAAAAAVSTVGGGDASISCIHLSHLSVLIALIASTEPPRGRRDGVGLSSSLFRLLHHDRRSPFCGRLGTVLPHSQQQRTRSLPPAFAWSLLSCSRPVLLSYRLTCRVYGWRIAHIRMAENDGVFSTSGAGTSTMRGSTATVAGCVRSAGTSSAHSPSTLWLSCALSGSRLSCIAAPAVPASGAAAKATAAPRAADHSIGGRGTAACEATDARDTGAAASGATQSAAAGSRAASREEQSPQPPGP